MPDSGISEKQPSGGLPCSHHPAIRELDWPTTPLSDVKRMKRKICLERQITLHPQYFSP